MSCLSDRQFLIEYNVRVGLSVVDHRNISAGESNWRVQLAFLSLGEMTQHLNHFHYYVDHVLKLGFIISQNIALAQTSWWVLEHSHYSQQLFPKVL